MEILSSSAIPPCVVALAVKRKGGGLVEYSREGGYHHVVLTDF